LAVVADVNAATLPTPPEFAQNIHPKRFTSFDLRKIFILDSLCANSLESATWNPCGVAVVLG
jgi:hypothetical protein